MLTIETSHPEIYQEFKKGNFSVQLSETNPFGRCKPGRVIETTINKDTKTPGGLTGSSTKTNAVDRWAINASYRASLYSHLQEFLGVNTKNHVYTDLQKSRIRNDQDDVTSILSIIEECFIDPFSENPLLSISNGLLATEKLVSDSFDDFKFATERMDTFIKQPCIEKSKDFFDSLKRINIETFSKLSKCAKYKCKDKRITLVANRNLFTKLTIIMQKLSIDLKEVFKYSLGPFPWALAGSAGYLKKLIKPRYYMNLKKKLDPVEPSQSDYINAIDGMAVVKKLKVKSKITFKEMPEKLLDEILKTSSSASQIYVVFDVYKTDSIKNAERIRRSSGQLHFRIIVASQKIKQWNQFLSSRDNKMQLIDRIKNTNSNIFYATTCTKCHNLSRVGMTEVSRLSTPQEEADTRMFLHAQYVLNHVQGNIIINSPDTDVFISLIVSEKINANINFKIGNKDKKRIINVNKVKESLKDKYDAVVSVGLECLTRALASLHAFTGCDTVSAFSGFGKFKIMAKNVDYTKLFEKVGKNWPFEKKIIRYIEGFVCHLYGYNEMKDTSMLRYRLFCAKKADCLYVKLPPCQSSLKQHCLRANYQSKILRLYCRLIFCSNSRRKWLGHHRWGNKHKVDGL